MIFIQSTPCRSLTTKSLYLEKLQRHKHLRDYYRTFWSDVTGAILQSISYQSSVTFLGIRHYKLNNKTCK